MKIFSLLMFLMFVGLDFAQAQKTIEIKLEKHKRIDKPARDEVSGIVKDPRFKDVFWVHGDSGTQNRIYAINSDGELMGKKKEGFEIEGIKNKDWEDIAISSDGTIYVADIGNNCSCRTDQSIIQVENLKADETEVGEVLKFDIKYQKPEGFLYRFLNYSMDAEALFMVKDDIYLLTKRFRGRETKLFRLESRSSDEMNEFKLIQSVDFDDEVTGADFAFGKLAVLTYQSLWIFEQNETSDFFDGSVTRYVFEADQVESVAFADDETVLIVEENGDMYKVSLANQSSK